MFSLFYHLRSLWNPPNKQLNTYIVTVMMNCQTSPASGQTFLTLHGRPQCPSPMDLNCSLWMQPWTFPLTSVDKRALVLHMWTWTYAIFNGYTNIPGPLHHRHPLQSYSTSQTFGGLQYINVPMIWMFCRHVHHLQRFYYVFTHHTSLHLQIFNTSYPHATTHPKNLRRHAYKYPITFLKLQVHRPTSPNILPFWSMLTLNIRYYSHTPCRLLIGSSKTFGPSSFCFLSTPNMIGTHHWRFLLCKNTHRHTLWHSSTPITLASLFAPFEV